MFCFERVTPLTGGLAGWQRCVVWIATRSGVKTAVQFELAHLTPHRSFDRGSSRPGSSLFGFGYRSTKPLRHPHCQFSLAASSSATLRLFTVWTWMPAGLRGTTNVNTTWIQLQMGHTTSLYICKPTQTSTSGQLHQACSSGAPSGPKTGGSRKL